MNILTPLNSVERIPDLVAAGANELYLGFYDDRWTETFGDYACLNRMSDFGRRANAYSFEEALDAIGKIKEVGAAAYVTLNANAYSVEERLDFIEERYVPGLLQSGADGVVVSELALARRLTSRGLRVVASTMCGIYNADIARCWASEGVSRMIIPRDVSLAELESICKSTPTIECEVFFMRNGCVFSDSHCLGMHRPGSMCGMLKASAKTVISPRAMTSFQQKHDYNLNDWLYNGAFHNDANGLTACGMCALYRLRTIGTKSLKIVGRADSWDSVLRDVALTKKNLEILDACDSEEEYLEKMAFPSDSSNRCKLGLACYYPEVRF